eukprot:3454774-Prymnesium_polylepis.1
MAEAIATRLHPLEMTSTAVASRVTTSVAHSLEEVSRVVHRAEEVAVAVADIAAESLDREDHVEPSRDRDKQLRVLTTLVCVVPACLMMWFSAAILLPPDVRERYPAVVYKSLFWTAGAWNATTSPPSVVPHAGLAAEGYGEIFLLGVARVSAFGLLPRPHPLALAHVRALPRAAREAARDAQAHGAHLLCRRPHPHARAPRPLGPARRAELPWHHLRGRHGDAQHGAHGRHRAADAVGAPQEAVRPPLLDAPLAPLALRAARPAHVLPLQPEAHVDALPRLHCALGRRLCAHAPLPHAPPRPRRVYAARRRRRAGPLPQSARLCASRGRVCQGAHPVAVAHARRRGRDDQGPLALRGVARLLSLHGRGDRGGAQPCKRAARIGPAAALIGSEGELACARGVGRPRGNLLAPRSLPRQTIWILHAGRPPAAGARRQPHVRHDADLCRAGGPLDQGAERRRREGRLRAPLLLGARPVCEPLLHLVGLWQHGPRRVGHRHHAGARRPLAVWRRPRVLRRVDASLRVDAR